MIKSIMLRFDKYLYETQKAYLIRIGHTEHWIPKKLCRDFVTNQKLGGNVSIPAFLYERITGQSIEDANPLDADYIITKHIPAPLSPIDSKPNAELTK